DLEIEMLVDNTQGLEKGSEVLYRGVSVGKITDTKVSRDSATITLNIREVAVIPEDSDFVVEQRSMLAGNVVQIYPGESDKNLSTGSTVEGKVKGDITQLAEKLGERAEGLERDIRDVLESADALVGEETRGGLISLIEETRGAVENFELTFEDNRETLAQTMRNLQTITDETKDPLNDSIKNVEEGSERLITTLDELQRVSQGLNRVLDDLESGEGSMGKMLYEPELYGNLNRSMEEMNALIRDIKENPDKYFSVSIF
ncbi:MAG: MlaD family protein, partial [Spirochaetia bacterium]